MTTTPPRPQSAATSTPPRRTPLQDVRLDESGVDTGTASTTDSPSRRSAAEVQRALTYSACFRRYELLIEYRSLAVNGPRGVWVMPTVDELNGREQGCALMPLLCMP